MLAIHFPPSYAQHVSILAHTKRPIHKFHCKENNSKFCALGYSIIFTCLICITTYHYSIKSGYPVPTHLWKFEWSNCRNFANIENAIPALYTTMITIKDIDYMHTINTCL